jgi:hypothetical protein
MFYNLGSDNNLAVDLVHLPILKPDAFAGKFVPNFSFNFL